MNTNRQSVLVLHGQSEVRVVIVLQMPEILLLVVLEQPPCRASVLPSVPPSVLEHLVSEQEIVSVDFAFFAKAFKF